MNVKSNAKDCESGTKQSLQNSYKVVGHFALNAQRHDDPNGTLCTFAYLCLCFHFGLSLFIQFFFISLAIFNYKTFYARRLLRSTALSTSPVHGMGPDGWLELKGKLLMHVANSTLFSLIIVIMLY